MGTAIEKKEPRPIDHLKMQLMKPDFQGWLQKQMAASMNRNADQLIRIFLQACTQSDFLAKCTPQSVLSSLCLAAQIGLVPNTALGHAWLVPFANNRKEGNKWISRTEAQLIIGYQGFVKLAYDAAGIVTQAHPVYQGDEFDYDLAGFPPVKFHRRGAQRGSLVYAYCLNKTPQGLVFGEVLDRSEIEARRNVSKSYRDKEGNPRKDSPWVLHEPEMWRKTVVRHCLKLTPKGSDERLERAIEVDDMDGREQSSVTDLVDLSAAPIDIPGALTLDGSDPAALGAASADEIERIKMEFASCDSIKALDDVAAKAPQSLRDSLGKSYVENADRIRSARSM